MGNKLGFAIIGCGSIGSRHAEQLNKINDAELIAVVDENPIKSSELAELYSVDWYTDFQRVLNRSDIDVINICTPSGLHSKIAIEAARAKKHVVIEKPIDITLDNADDIIRICRQSGVKLSVISQHRFNDSVQLLKDRIDKGKFGKLFLCEAAVNWYRTEEYYKNSGWRGTWKLDGGGAFMNQSIHVIDLMQYFMGPVESVKAEIGTFNQKDIEVEDTAMAIIKFKSGGLGTIVGTTAAYPGFPVKIGVFGSGGTAIMESYKFTHVHQKDYDNNQLNLAENYQQLIDRKINKVIHPHKEQLEDMIKAIKNDREPLVNGEEGRKALEVILGIYDSARTGQTIFFSEKKQLVTH